MPVLIFFLISCERDHFRFFLASFTSPGLCSSPAGVIFIGLCYLHISVLDYVSPFANFSARCFKFRACRESPVQPTGFLSSLPTFLLIRIICVCIGRTLLKSNSKSARLLFPKVPIISILPTGFCQNWVQSRSSLYCLLCLLGNEMISKAGQEIVSVLLLRNGSFCKYFKTEVPNTKICGCPDNFVVCTGNTSSGRNFVMQSRGLSLLCLSTYVPLDLSPVFLHPQVLQFTYRFTASKQHGLFTYLFTGVA